MMGYMSIGRYVYMICDMAGYSETPCRMFLQMSYVCLGCGRESRDAQFVVHQCVHLLYALRCTFLFHCLETMPPSLVTGPEDLSLSFLNSTKQNAFAALQDIKRPGNACIAHDNRQNVTWIGFKYDSLNVHAGTLGLDRIPVSHLMLRATFHGLCGAIVVLLRHMGIPVLTWRQFTELQDSTSCKTPCEGMGAFNPGLKIQLGQDFQRDARFQWMLNVTWW